LCKFANELQNHFAKLLKNIYKTKENEKKFITDTERDGAQGSALADYCGGAHAP
jgi:hypothetical protein